MSLTGRVLVQVKGKNYSYDRRPFDLRGNLVFERKRISRVYNDSKFYPVECKNRKSMLYRVQSNHFSVYCVSFFLGSSGSFGQGPCTSLKNEVGMERSVFEKVFTP